MTTSLDSVELASKVLKEVWLSYKPKGLLSIYLWGSVITPDYNPKNSDIDAVGILDDEANFDDLNKIRDWLPEVESRLRRLQINFFYLSELQGQKHVKSNFARLHDPEQAVADFNNWEYVCGTRFSYSDFPAPGPASILQHQIQVVKERLEWAKQPNKHYGARGLEYFCKSLVWLCHDIHKLKHPRAVFSWKALKAEAEPDTKSLVYLLENLKQNGWQPQQIKESLPSLIELSDALINKYG